ncbi:MAG TPA: AbrB/MazE/SpoVT family DNA-binding domain-containing protein [Candidatus Paceibacterota bacterium]|jgi:bifunctional DNA-binding transcriptional regulator/antitoxin component of YhaV-PrlF toxin-antitoxin module|nr:AbrB/MazE/SpoVT family DNA-binding domain-containing protein [Candidatus Paceibacterota bacterium]HPY13082.1 AbrB/MazE/SpoVT family DNA-binding domain-containing protein [Candidatus Paceibacterota bacterium]HQB27116.1 AbrB/MazE/SpoVT family DNA-binding domain-containing protein [Candidatus Paceibacterota bacterium]
MRKLADKNTRKLQKLGKTSLAVTIPKEIITELKWREKQRVKIIRIRGGFVVRDYRSK